MMKFFKKVADVLLKFFVGLASFSALATIMGLPIFLIIRFALTSTFLNVLLIVAVLISVLFLFYELYKLGDLLLIEYREKRK